jgi:hypothetical protein
MSDNEPSRKGSLVALLVVVAMVAVGLYISHRLRDAAAIQDCVSSGRSNCARIETTPRPG